MRLFHTADIHIGKRLGNRELSADLREVMLGQVLGTAYEKYRPDGLIISGDIFDRSAPSAEAVALFDEILSRAAELRLPVYMISGNHDSAQRISYGREIFRHAGVHISRPFTADGGVYFAECGDIDIALLPYVSMEQVKSCFPEEEIGSMTDAMRVVLERSGLPREGRPCVLAAHQAVGGFGGDPIGTLELVDPAVFSRFAYTALGHFHTPRNAAENVRYCGSPLCYSLNEVTRGGQKYLDIIDIAQDGAVSVEQFPLTPLHGSAVISDSIGNILSDKYAPSEDFVYITITENDSGGNNAERIARKFPNYVSIAYKLNGVNADVIPTAQAAELTFGELLGGFYKEMCGRDIDPALLETAREIFEECRREEDSL
ncbi:MAG: exonuclease SbcCD subunit D [Oscillospiraceae bacterium]